MADTRLRAGDLSHRITATAPAGVLAEAAVTVDTHVPMSILGIQASEILAAGGQQSATVYKLRCRYRTDLKTSFVLTEECCTERTFQIIEIIPSDRRDSLDMTCVQSERVA